MKTMNEVLRGDCLDLLADLPAGCADLVYADPPYASGRVFDEFDDRWDGGLDGYLEWMRPRLEQCRRVLADTGSFWLHCDPTASAYLRVMCDGIFGRQNYRNEIVWCFTGPGNRQQQQFTRKHHLLYWYTGGDNWVFHPVRTPYKSPVKGRKEWLRGDNDLEQLQKELAVGKILEDWWTDIPSSGHFGWVEHTGYPTQKPKALLERIIKASSNEGDLVADPFCGSGTALVAAKRLGRRWWGCDLNAEAVAITEGRLAVETAPLEGLAV